MFRGIHINLFHKQLGGLHDVFLVFTQTIIFFIETLTPTAGVDISAGPMARRVF